MLLGTPLDLITFHAKGSPTFLDNRVRMGVANQLRSIDEHFLVIRDFPMYARTPIVIGESDPDGCAACGATYYPQNGYRKGTLYATYTAEQIARNKEINAHNQSSDRKEIAGSGQRATYRHITADMLLQQLVYQH